MNSLPPANSSDADTPICGGCRLPVRHNVPRLGASAGWVHAHDGSHLCAMPTADRKVQRITPDCQPVFPCWLGRLGRPEVIVPWQYFLKRPDDFILSCATHWSHSPADRQPDAPQEVPINFATVAQDSPIKPSEGVHADMRPNATPAKAGEVERSVPNGEVAGSSPACGFPFPASVDAGTRKEETPRTDAAYNQDRGMLAPDMVGFARTLERELNAQTHSHAQTIGIVSDAFRERDAATSKLTALTAQRASLAEQLEEAKKELKIWRDANNAKDTRNGPRVI